MSGLFSALNITRSALDAYQKALDVTAHNISNAGNPAYSRQVVDLAPTTPYTDPALTRPMSVGQLGTGVTVAAVRRVHDEVLNEHLRGEGSLLGEQRTLSSALRLVEGVLAEPSGGGISGALRGLFQSFHELANQPESLGIRRIVLQRAVAMTDAFHTAANQLDAVRQSLDRAAQGKVSEINQLAHQVAELNAHIARSLAVGDQPNDLLDSRDQLLDQLAQRVGIQVVADAGRPTQSNGQVSSRNEVSVLIGGMDLVRDDAVNELKAPADVKGGELGGLLRARDVILSAAKNLDTLAQTLIERLNGIHRTGYALDGSTGRDFLTGSDARTISVAAALVADPRLLAASATPGAEGNGDIALALANLENSPVLDGGDSTLEGFYQATLTQIGQATQQATVFAEHEESVVKSLTDQRQTLSGVNLNEEFINLIRYQRGFEAAARVLNVVDELLDVVINRMGT